jgi:hypothetical protein
MAGLQKSIKSRNLVLVSHSSDNFPPLPSIASFHEYFFTSNVSENHR